jgi:hypothetical protein
MTSLSDSVPFYTTFSILGYKAARENPVRTDTQRVNISSLHTPQIMAPNSYRSHSQRSEVEPAVLDRQVPEWYDDPEFMQEYEDEVDGQDPSRRTSTTPKQELNSNGEQILPTARTNRDSSISTFSYVNNDHGSLSRAVGYQLQTINPDHPVLRDYRVSRAWPSMMTRAEAENYYADLNRDIMHNLSHINYVWSHHEPLTLYPSRSQTIYVPRGMLEMVSAWVRDRFELPSRLHLRALVQSAKSLKTQIKHALTDPSNLASSMSQQLRRVDRFEALRRGGKTSANISRYVGERR